MISPVYDMEFWLGKTMDEVLNLVSLPGMLPQKGNFRIVREDKNFSIITMNLDTSRVNFEFDNNIVTKAYLG